MLSFKKGVTFILASSSPRRKELLSSCGLKFDVVVSDIDETPLADESPQAMVERLALEKARVVAKRYPDALVLGADVTVVLKGENLGKPNDKADAKRMLTALQGNIHEVWGGYALLNISQDKESRYSIVSRVEIAPMSQRSIDTYIQSGEPMDKAGSYGIQGIGAHIVRSVQGSYSNVVGLDLAAVVEKLREFDLLQS